MVRPPSAYEVEALRLIEDWKVPSEGLIARVGRVVTAPVGWVSDAVMATPLVGTALEKAMAGGVSLANDLASWSVRPDAILAEYRRKGSEQVTTLADVSELDLEEIDRCIGYLAAKYKGWAAGQGAALGVAGGATAWADVPLVLSEALRAIAEYATYCGFDMSLQQERIYAMQVLSYASSPAGAAKGEMIRHLNKVGVQLAKRATWKELERSLFVRTLREIAQSVGIRLTKAKLAQVVPVAGAVVGAGFNAWYLNQVCDTAFNLYRERFINTHRRVE